MTNVRLQNLRDFTVQIRDVNDKVVGTGIAVSTDGKIVTCAHVVEAAGIDPRNANSAEVGVYFPQARGGEEKNRRALVAKHFPDYDDDVVLLQLTGGSSPLAPEQIAVVGSTGNLRNRDFDSFGYRSLGGQSIGKYISGAPAHGKILGTVELLEESNFHKEPLMLESNQLNAGMSGAGVLDIEDNLVVGIVSHVYDPDATGRDRDAAFGVDARVLPLPPFDFSIRTEPLTLKAAPSPKFDIAQAEAAVFIKDKYSWNSAPSILPEWTGRDDLLAEITKDWNNSTKHVTGLIGFGGEGKSSLARKWIETLDLQPSTFDGLFWWGFYENRSIDEFLEAALNFLSGGRIDPRQVPSSSLRAQIIGAMLGAGRYLFVLDGLEVLQHQEGDQYGLLQSNDLRDLLTYFARPDNQSFCLITSRAPLLDLMEYTTYTHRDVERLSEADGVALLERLQVKGTKSQLGKVVADWDGHALTISLLGSYLAEKYSGDIAHLADIPIPTADEPRYERVHRVLRRYDEHLTESEREFLKLFSAFRTPVHESAFEKVFAPLLGNAVGAQHAAPLPTPQKQKGFFARLFGSKTDSPNNDFQISNIVSRLVTYRILHCDTTSQTYTAHPLVRNHYLAILTHGDSTEQHDIHGKIKDYYLSIAGDTPQYPTLDDLKPLIEVVHHACQAGAYDEAFKVYSDRIIQGNSAVIAHQLGAYDTQTAILLEFFPQNDLNQDPYQSIKVNIRLYILGTLGNCYLNLGRLTQAISPCERGNKVAESIQDWANASISCRNLADLHAQLGALEASAEAAHQALDLARKAENKTNETNSLYYQAWANYLLGNMELAGKSFSEAEKLNREVYSHEGYLHSLMGIGHAIYLRRTGSLDYARRVNKANLEDRKRGHKVNQLSDCYRVLGDLDFDSNNHESAHAHYESALKIARSISLRQVLIEALLARGRFFAKVAVGATHPSQTETVSGKPSMQNKLTNGIDGSPLLLTEAFTDLNEALNYALEGGYRIYEADIRVALAWAYLANGEKEKAKESAQRALQMSQEMGYHWDKVDAEEMMNASREG